MWLNQDFLVKIEGKKIMHRNWKQEQVSWEGYRNIVQLCSDAFRKAGAELDKGHNRLLQVCQAEKEGCRKLTLASPMNMSGKLVVVEEKAEVLEKLFLKSVFIGKPSHSS